MFRELTLRYGGEGRLHYRRRTERSGHKTGNIADFVRRWGAPYEFMLVLDADSIMTGNALVTLARLMEAHPQIGILQSLPLLAGHETLFGRIIQFGARLQSPMLGSVSPSGNSTTATTGTQRHIAAANFTAHCGLPRLLADHHGEEILSHDFVEAALMRSAGYEVRQLPDLEGSWEEVPGNVIDYAARDRRWAQGNLQHLRLLNYPRLRFMSRCTLSPASWRTSARRCGWRSCCSVLCLASLSQRSYPVFPARPAFSVPPLARDPPRRDGGAYPGHAGCPAHAQTSGHITRSRERT
jgi:membrane glycosyltransferase